MSKKILSISVFLAIVGISGMFSPDVFADKEKKIKWEKSKDGLGALINYANSAGQMEKDSKKENANYEKASKAVNANELKKGMTTEEVIREIGDPVIKVPSPSSGKMKWVYKKGNASYFEGQKVYLFFNDKDILENWEFIPKKEEEKKPSQEIESVDKKTVSTDFVSDKKTRTRSNKRRSGMI